MDKLNKTETKVMAALERIGKVSTDPGKGVRYIKAIFSLESKGLLKRVRSESGSYYSNHGRGREQYSRPNYFTLHTFTAAK